MTPAESEALDKARKAVYARTQAEHERVIAAELALIATRKVERLEAAEIAALKELSRVVLPGSLG